MSGASCAPPILWLSTNAVQLTVPIGDDGQLMSWPPPVLWLSTHAVQLTVPIGDDGQLMSWGPPVLWLSTHAVQLFRRLRRALFRSSFAFLSSVRQTLPFLFRSSFLSSDFSVPLLFLFSALQTFPFLFVPLFRSSDFSARISFLFSVLVSARHVLDGGFFRSIGN